MAAAAAGTPLMRTMANIYTNSASRRHTAASAAHYHHWWPHRLRITYGHYLRTLGGAGGVRGAAGRVNGHLMESGAMVVNAGEMRAFAV